MPTGNPIPRRSSFAAVAATVLVMLAACDGQGSTVADPAPTTAETDWSPGIPVDRADLCELVGTEAVTALGERYGYEVEPPEAKTDRGICTHRLQRMKGELTKESLLVQASADRWNDWEEARRAFDAKSDPASPRFALDMLYPESTVRSELDSPWDEGVLMSDATWEDTAEFKVLVLRDGVILRYDVQLGLKGSTEDCSVSVTGDCVISPEIVSAWITAELLPDAFDKIQDAGLIRS